MGSNQSNQSANSDQNLESFPQHLQTYDALVQHFRAQLEGLSTFEKGSRFAKFIQKLLPQTELAKDFAEPVLNVKQSHDDGVDLSAKAKVGEYELHGQAKLYIDRVETLDSIISKFKAHAIKKRATDTQQNIFSEEDSKDAYLIATLSKLDGIIARYEKSNLTSKTFFRH